MGKPRKLLSQQKGNLTVLQQEEKRLTEERMNQLEKLSPEPPEWLDSRAKEEYERIYPLISELPSAALDLACVSAYCQAYSDYINATIRMSEGDAVIETPNGTKLNQNHAIKRDALSQINSLAPKIGLTIDSRMKIFTPKEKEKKTDPFEAMLNGGK